MVFICSRTDVGGFLASPLIKQRYTSNLITTLIVLSILYSEDYTNFVFQTHLQY